MAGEQKGRTYEAIVKLALDQLVDKLRLDCKVFWNETPDGMSIEPDFTLGADKNRPSHLFLVTHSSSSKDSDKKFWRNMGELAEAKTRLSTLPKVYSIVFDSVIKPDLKELQSAAFDGQLLVGDSAYGRSLLAWVDQNSPTLPKDGHEKAQAIKAAIQERSTKDGLKSLVGLFVKDLNSLIQIHRTDLEKMWRAERARPLGRSPGARTTAVRRGLGKMVVLEDVSVAYSGKPISGKATGRMGIHSAVGLTIPSVVGAVIRDPDVRSAVELVPIDHARVIVEEFRPKAERWTRMIHGLEHLDKMLEYVLLHLDELSTPTGYFQLLRAQHEGKTKGIPALGYTWLFYVTAELVKQAGRARQSFGMAQILGSITANRHASQYKRAIAAICGVIAPEFRGVRSIERLLSVQLGDRKSLGSDSLFSIHPVDLAEVCFVLAQRLKAAECRNINCVDLRAGLIQKVFENDLLTYRLFEPLKRLIELSVPEAKEVKLRHAFAEKATGRVRADAGRITVLRASNSIIKWQSAHGSHTKDKKKELCGRGIAIRYSWDQHRSAFVRRPGIEKLLLVIDGDWNQGDLDALSRAGWDGIFYPDEMDRLIKAIV